MHLARVNSILFISEEYLSMAFSSHDWSISVAFSSHDGVNHFVQDTDVDPQYSDGFLQASSAAQRRSSMIFPHTLNARTLPPCSAKPSMFTGDLTRLHHSTKGSYRWNHDETDKITTMDATLLQLLHYYDLLCGSIGHLGTLCKVLGRSNDEALVSIHEHDLKSNMQIW